MNASFTLGSARYAEKNIEALISESLLGRDIEQGSISFARRGTGHPRTCRAQSAAEAGALLCRQLC